MRGILVVGANIYWLVIACLPFLPIYLHSRVQERVNCGLADGCLAHAMPFIAEMGIACALLGLFLWPLSVWHLGGQWLWKRTRKTHEKP